VQNTYYYLYIALEQKPALNGSRVRM